MQNSAFKFLCSFLTLGLALTLVACKPVPPPTTTPSAPVEISDNGVIFSAEQSAEVEAIFTAESTWTPTAADVAKLEAGLTTFLQGAENPWLRTDPPIWDRVPQYHRQYLGIVQDGEEIIYANFFCRAYGEEWQTEYVFVMDGGDCFFQLKYNPQIDEFFDLVVNGES